MTRYPRVAFGIRVAVGCAWAFVIIHAQEPTAVFGTSNLQQAPGLLERWLNPEALTMLALVITYVVDIRGEVKRLRVDMDKMMTFKDGLPKALDDEYVTSRQFEEYRRGLQAGRGQRHE